MPIFRTDLVHEDAEGNETFEPIEVMYGGQEEINVEKVWSGDNEIYLSKEKEEKVIRQIIDDAKEKVARPCFEPWEM